MAQSLKNAIICKFKDALPAKQLNSLLFDLKCPTNGPTVDLHLQHAQLRPHIADTAAFQSLLGSDLNDGQLQITKTGVAFALRKDQLYTETLANPLAHSVIDENRPDCQPQTILVEFSSPNIAKPFHVGHLRSTIIGNFAANILRRSRHQHRVHRINYLGDWGTQFGYLAIGMRMRRANNSDSNDEQQLQQNPIQHLFEAYVQAHAAAERDPTITTAARQLFCQLEHENAADTNNNNTDAGSSAELAQWNRYREYTINELRTTYTRLGVAFDEYSWESDYRLHRIRSYLDAMLAAGVLQPDSASDAFVAQVNADGRRVPALKSDGTTMYLARDCAALQDRADRHRFDRMLYVVDNGQFDHFRNVFAVGQQMRVAGIDGCEHVKFGRIQGMSTRKGNVVFLRDILDEARDRMHEKQLQSRNTRVDVTDTSDRRTADILGVSAVIVNDLRQRRQRDYVFDWDKALRMNGDTGVRLQYTHCRLCSLAASSLAASTRSSELDNDVRLLREPEAEQLLFEMARYGDVLARSELQLEACVLVVYLFGLCNSINRALLKLSVKDERNEAVRAQRLRLFAAARQILHDGMVILGLQPLEKM